MEQSISLDREADGAMPKSWLRPLYWLGLATQLSLHRDTDVGYLNSDQPEQLADGGSSPAEAHDSESSTERAVSEDLHQRAAGSDEFARQVPEPYILGPQAYSDPSVWLPDDAKEPLVADEQYTDTLEWLERMDELADSDS